jgi:hypothetical protein
LSTFFASPAVKIHQIKKYVLFNSRPQGVYRLMSLTNAITVQGQMNSKSNRGDRIFPIRLVLNPVIPATHPDPIA